MSQIFSNYSYETYSFNFPSPPIPKYDAAVTLSSANPMFIHFKAEVSTNPKNTFNFWLTEIWKLVFGMSTFQPIPPQFLIKRKKVINSRFVHKMNDESSNYQDGTSYMLTNSPALHIIFWIIVIQRPFHCKDFEHLFPFF